jgi:ribose 5-phosphate isomerase B
MKIAIGADHAGYYLKEELRAELAGQGHEVTDFGTDSGESTDYPDYGTAVARAVAEGKAERGVVVCSTGVGMSMAANKVAGVRAVLAYNADEVALSRQHNNANVLALGARYVNARTAGEWMEIFLTTPFQGGRHQRRVDKIEQGCKTEGKER